MNSKFFLLIFALVLISLASAIQEPLIYYKINLDYSYGDITINSTEIELSNEAVENNFGFYSAIILDYEGSLLNLTLFDVPNGILYDSIDESGVINDGGFLELNQTSFEIFVPYYENAKEIVIYNENLTELTRKNISEFSRVQERKIEDISEETETKRIDEKSAETLTEKLSQYWWVLVIVLVILAGYLIYYLNKKK